MTQMKTIRVNLNSTEPQIIVDVLMRPVARYLDTEANRLAAIEQAKLLWAEGLFVEVQCWKSGRGQGIFKRTTGHCYG